MDNEAFEIEAQALAQILDELDYFQILKIAQHASPVEIKAAYYRESRAYHPDRYSTLPPGELKDNIGRIYKRINEAYVCLRDDVSAPSTSPTCSAPTGRRSCASSRPASRS